MKKSNGWIVFFIISAVMMGVFIISKNSTSIEPLTIDESRIKLPPFREWVFAIQPCPCSCAYHQRTCKGHRVPLDREVTDAHGNVVSEYKGIEWHWSEEIKGECPGEYEFRVLGGVAVRDADDQNKEAQDLRESHEFSVAASAFANGVEDLMGSVWSDNLDDENQMEAYLESGDLCEEGCYAGEPTVSKFDSEWHSMWGPPFPRFPYNSSRSTHYLYWHTRTHEWVAQGPCEPEDTPTPTPEPTQFSVP